MQPAFCQPWGGRQRGTGWVQAPRGEAWVFWIVAGQEPPPGGRTLTHRGSIPRADDEEEELGQSR